MTKIAVLGAVIGLLCATTAPWPAAAGAAVPNFSANG